MKHLLLALSFLAFAIVLFAAVFGFIMLGMWIGEQFSMWALVAYLLAFVIFITWANLRFDPKE